MIQKLFGPYIGRINILVLGKLYSELPELHLDLLLRDVLDQFVLDYPRDELVDAGYSLVYRMLLEHLLQHWISLV